MFRTVVKFRICNTENIKNSPNFPQSVIMVVLLVDFFVIVCEMQVQSDVQEMVSCHGIRVKTCEELFCPCPIVPEPVTNFVAHLYNNRWNKNISLYLEEGLVFCHVCPNTGGSIC
jgi:hypothetical protein